MISRCRIYLFTYKRSHLLPRAIQSLKNQKYSNWVCEIHNDCPEDSFPEEYITLLKDDRFILKNHKVNIGPNASFNLAYQGCAEEYASILEDDNWWEPDFLEEIIAIMDSNPEINIAWSNMHIWKEKKNNIWENTCKTVWPLVSKNMRFTRPHAKQAMGALHSNGAMLYRGKYAKNYLIPHTCDFSIMEAVRERTFAFPLYLSCKTGANFSETMQTSRSNAPLLWTSGQIMLLGSFIKASSHTSKTFKQTLRYYRNQTPSPVANFFLANIFLIKDRSLFKFFNLLDWLLFGKWLFRNGFKLWYIKQYLESQNDVYRFLLQHTYSRYQKD